MVVRPGQRLPVDGVVTGGLAAVNQVPMTGDSLSGDKSAGSEILSGAFDERGRREVRTAKVRTDTMLTRIAHPVDAKQHFLAGNAGSYSTRWVGKPGGVDLAGEADAGGDGGNQALASGIAKALRQAFV